MTNMQIEQMIESLLIDWRALQSERQWTSMEVNHTNTVRPVFMIHYGPIHSNGMHEIAIGTRSYFMQDGKVFYNTQAHS